MCLAVNLKCFGLWKSCVLFPSPEFPPLGTGLQVVTEQNISDSTLVRTFSTFQHQTESIVSEIYGFVGKAYAFLTTNFWWAGRIVIWTLILSQLFNHHQSSQVNTLTHFQNGATFWWLKQHSIFFSCENSCNEFFASALTNSAFFMNGHFRTFRDSPSSIYIPWVNKLYISHESTIKTVA